MVVEIMENRKDFLQLFDGSLAVEQITNSWYNKYKNSNFGEIGRASCRERVSSPV